MGHLCLCPLPPVVSGPLGLLSRLSPFPCIGHGIGLRLSRGLQQPGPVPWCWPCPQSEWVSGPSSHLTGGDLSYLGFVMMVLTTQSGLDRKLDGAGDV